MGKEDVCYLMVTPRQCRVTTCRETFPENSKKVIQNNMKPTQKEEEYISKNFDLKEFFFSLARALLSLHVSVHELNQY